MEVTRRVLVSEGETARLGCTVDSFPRTQDTVKWSREGFDIGIHYLMKIRQNLNIYLNKTTRIWASKS